MTAAPSRSARASPSALDWRWVSRDAVWPGTAKTSTHKHLTCCSLHAEARLPAAVILRGGCRWHTRQRPHLSPRLIPAHDTTRDRIRRHNRPPEPSRQRGRRAGRHAHAPDAAYDDRDRRQRARTAAARRLREIAGPHRSAGDGLLARHSAPAGHRRDERHNGHAHCRALLLPFLAVLTIVDGALRAGAMAAGLPGGVRWAEERRAFGGHPRGGVAAKVKMILPALPRRRAVLASINSRSSRRLDSPRSPDSCRATWRLRFRTSTRTDQHVGRSRPGRDSGLHHVGETRVSARRRLPRTRRVCGAGRTARDVPSGRGRTSCRHDFHRTRRGHVAAIPRRLRPRLPGSALPVARVHAGRPPSDQARSDQAPSLPRPELDCRSRGRPHVCDFCYKEAFFEGGRGFYTQRVDQVLLEIDRLPGRHLYFLTTTCLAIGDSRQRCSARLAGLSVSKPTNRLRSPAATAFSSRSGRSTELTVPGACHSRPMPRMPSNSAAAKRRSPNR